MHDLHTHTHSQAAFHLILGRVLRHDVSELALLHITGQRFSRLICKMHLANTPKLGQVCPIRIVAFQTGEEEEVWAFYYCL